MVNKFKSTLRLLSLSLCAGMVFSLLAVGTIQAKSLGCIPQLGCVIQPGDCGEITLQAKADPTHQAIQATLTFLVFTGLIMGGDYAILVMDEKSPPTFMTDVTGSVGWQFSTTFSRTVSISVPEAYVYYQVEADVGHVPGGYLGSQLCKFPIVTTFTRSGGSRA